MLSGGDRANFPFMKVTAIADRPLSPAVQVAVAAMVILGFIGGTLIAAQSGYETSPKRGGPSVFVPTPQAYILSALMFGMSIIGWVVLVLERLRSVPQRILSVLFYVLLAVSMTYLFSNN